MSKEERFVLYFLCFLEFVWGLWLVVSVINQREFIISISFSRPNTMMLLGMMMMGGAMVSLFLTHRSIVIFIVLVTIPTTFLGLLFLQKIFANPPVWQNFVIITSVGIFGAIYAGTVFGKIRPPNWTKGTK